MRSQAALCPVTDHVFIAQLAAELGLHGNNILTKRILQLFFKNLRIRIPVIASRTLITYLPKELKSLYQYGWDSKQTLVFDYDEFIHDLYQSGRLPFNLFIDKMEVGIIVLNIFEVIHRHTTKQQYDFIMSLLPTLSARLETEYVFDDHNYFL
jgi:uncharacterized protein (DUF2267 family)